jgi:hypothetical protein
LPPDTTTIAALREMMATYYFPEIATVIRRCREAGLIAAGKAGRGGVGSARATPRDCALLLIAASAPGPISAAPAEALRIAGFRLRYLERTRATEPHSLQFIDTPMTFIEFLVAQIDGIRGAVPDLDLVGWRISRHQAMQRSPERLVFTGPEMPVYPDPRLEPVERSTAIPARLIRDIAALFAPLPPAEHEPALLAEVTALFKRVQSVRSAPQQRAAHG